MHRRHEPTTSDDLLSPTSHRDFSSALRYQLRAKIDSSDMASKSIYARLPNLLACGALKLQKAQFGWVGEYGILIKLADK